MTPLLRQIPSLLALGVIALMASTSEASRRPIPNCAPLLLSPAELEQSIRSAKLLSADQLAYKNRYNVQLGDNALAQVYAGSFRGFGDVDAPGHTSPRNALAAYKLDQILGGFGRIPTTLELMHDKKWGVFALEPRPTVIRPNILPRGESIRRYDLAIIDFLLQKFPRDRKDLRIDIHKKSWMINNWDSFGRSEPNGPTLSFSDRQILTRALSQASRKLIQLLLKQTPESLEVELLEVLSKTQLEQLWQRFEILQILNEKASKRG